jgi:hypothetical protein
MDSFSWKNMCEHFIFILSHAGKSGDVLCLALSLNQIVASSGSRNVCVVSPLCSCATAALSHFPTGNLSKHLGFTIYHIHKGLMLVPALLPQLGVKSPTNQLVAGESMFENHQS